MMNHDRYHYIHHPARVGLWLRPTGGKQSLPFDPAPRTGLPRHPADRDTHTTTGHSPAQDYFKRFLASLRNIFGGRVQSYESLLDRARREAILRMKAEARALGADMVFNIKLETASIYKGKRNTIGAVEVLAYGTACVPHNRET
jgi:uncharacterized protein YbjQ (UPF0145 family)